MDTCHGFRNSAAIYLCLLLLFFRGAAPQIYAQIDARSADVKDSSQTDGAKKKAVALKLDSEKRIESVYASDNEKIVYIVYREGILEAYETTDGGKLWSVDLGDEIISDVLETGDGLYVLSNRKSVEKSDTENDDMRQASDMEVSTVEKRNDEVSGEQVNVWNLDKNPGITRDVFRAAPRRATEIYKYGRYFLFVSVGRGVDVYDSDFNLLDEYKIENIEGISAEQGKLRGRTLFDVRAGELFLNPGRRIIELKIGDGKLSKAKIQTSDVEITVFSVSDGFLFIGDKNGTVKAVRRTDSSEAWRFQSGGKISSLELFGGRLVIASHDNFIYCLDAVSGRRYWKRRLPGRAAGLFRQTNGRFLVGNSYENDLAAFSVSDGKFLDKILISDAETKLIVSQNNELRLIMQNNLIFFPETAAVR